MSIGWHIDQTLDESESENKNLPSRGIKISDECVYDWFLNSTFGVALKDKC